jgi:hypothetical protein
MRRGLFFFIRGVKSSLCYNEEEEKKRGRYEKITNHFINYSISGGL